MSGVSDMIDLLRRVQPLVEFTYVYDREEAKRRPNDERLARKRDESYELCMELRSVLGEES